MPRVRAGFKGRYALSKHEFYTAYHYALQYGEWKDMYNALSDSTGAIVYDKDKVSTSRLSDPTENLAEKRVVLSKKMRIVEDTAREADEELYPYLLKAVTNEGVTYQYLRLVMLMPACKDVYYDRRRKFYWLLTQKIREGSIL